MAAGYGAADQAGAQYPAYGENAQPLKPRNKVRRPNRTEVVVLVLVPWLTFCMVSCLSAFAHYEFRAAVYVVDGSWLFLSLLLIVLGAQRRISVHMGLGVLCFFAVCAGACVGLFIDAEFASEYYRLDKGASYQDVEATTNSTSYGDATALTFQAGTIVYSEATIGYMEGGEVYCVAPIVSNKDSNLLIPPVVQFWAVGEDCCGMRGDFECDDATVGPEALGASVILEPSHGYRQAVRMMPAVHGLASEHSAIFLRWVKDPQAFRNEILRNAVLLCVGACIAHLSASAMCGIAIALAPPNY